MKDKTKKMEVHGDHWSGIFSSDSDLTKLIAKAVSYKANDGMLRGVSPYTGIISFEKPIRILTLIETRHGKSFVSSSYPFLEIKNPIRLTIDKIEEWSNGVEAVITGTTRRRTILSFFDTLYFQNKEKYKKESEYVFNIAGLAYKIKKRDPKILEFIPETGPLKGKKVSTHGMTGYQFDEVYTDDFIFMNPYNKIKKTHIFNKVKFYEFSYHLNPISDEAEPLYFPIFIRESILDNSKIKLGEDIDGTGWLTGYLDGTLKI